MRSPSDDAKGEIIVPAHWGARADPVEREFLAVIKDFSPRDLFIVARLLDRIRYINTHDGPDGALAVIERLCGAEQPSRR